ncbi:MAG: M3 family metallopeptidase [Muribaculaceae bacterium]|nr:M3 family metallopeptidase [Muribaculaceae bacterium]
MNRFLLGTITALSLMTMANEAQGGSNNPLLVPSDAPYQAVPFNKIQLPDYEEAIMEAIKIHDGEIEAIVSTSEEPTFENTIAALDRSGSLLNESVLALSNLVEAVGDTTMMQMMTRVTPILSDHSTGLLLNDKLWQRIKKVHETKGERSDLSPEAMRLIDETYRSFAESGANLEGEAREKYRKLSAELSDLNVKFSQNVTNGMADPERRMWVKEADTAGLPESIKAAAREAAKEALEAEGKPDDTSLYLFTVYAPSYTPFMKYADNRELREKLYKINGSRNVGGQYDNTQILKDIANIRLEIANLMGKKTFAEYQLQGTMAATPERVMELLEDLRQNYTAPMQAELKEIEEYAQRTEGADFKLMPWDYSYWSDKLKNDKYAFNDEDMKPYFELENTINGVLGLATKLYGYTFKENKNIPVYHPDVKAYEVYEKDGSILGILYADFFYRPGKAPGAWMTEFRTETKDDNGKRTLPLISIVCNFSKPVGKEAVLLTPYEVETFLHEFGHALHGLSAQATYASLSGTNVYHDFVELFSQFNENYLTEQQFLDSFAKHYKTGKKMPKDLIEKFIRAQQYAAAYACMRQLGFGYLDMAYHTIEEPLRASSDVAVFEEKAQDPVRVFDVVEGCLTSPSFGHIFSGGYAAGYYGYKWAELLDADAFAAFQENGIFDKKTADKFKKMLQSGGTVDPMELYIEFRGKEPTVDALLHRDGIK